MIIMDNIKFLFHDLLEALDCKERLENKLSDSGYDDIRKSLKLEITNSKVYVVNVKLWVAQENTSANLDLEKNEMSSL